MFVVISIPANYVDVNLAVRDYFLAMIQYYLYLLTTTGFFFSGNMPQQKKSQKSDDEATKTACELHALCKALKSNRGHARAVDFCAQTKLSKEHAPHIKAIDTGSSKKGVQIFSMPNHS